MVHGVAARVTSATGDSGPSQQLDQPSSVRASNHLLDAIVVRGSLPWSARQTPIIQIAQKARSAARKTVIRIE